MCDNLSFINTTQKTFKPYEKNVSMPRMDEKNFIPGNFSWSIAAETGDASCFKKWPPPPSPPAKLKFLTLPAKTFSKFLSFQGGACPESSIKTKSLNTKPCLAGLSPRIICQASPFLPKMSQNCCTHQVWTVPPSPEPLWVTLGMRKNSTQQSKIYSFPPSEKSSLIDLNLSLSKVSFLPHETAIFK